MKVYVELALMVWLGGYKLLNHFAVCAFKPCHFDGEDKGLVDTELLDRILIEYGLLPSNTELAIFTCNEAHCQPEIFEYHARDIRDVGQQ